MHTVTGWWRRLLARVSRKKRETDLDREVRDHLYLETHERIDGGLSSNEAETVARRTFGNVMLTKERVRDAWGWTWFASLVEDVRFALRSFRRSPVLVFTIVVTLGIGIGANTAMFSVIRGVLLSPLDYTDPERLVYLDIARGGDAGPGRFSMVRFELLQAEAESFSSVGAFLGNTEDIALAGDGAPEALSVARVTSNFLDVLGVAPLVGRSFTAEEDVAGAPRVSMISARLWRRRFNADSAVAGMRVTLDATPYTVVGVLPDGFTFPFPEVDVWTTRPAEPSFITGPAERLTLLAGFARLRPDATMTEARAELDLLDERYRTLNPDAAEAAYGTGPMRMTALQRQLTEAVDTMLWVLFAAVACVLLIAAANIASLLMARAVSRGREFALRRAIGAGTGRIVNQLLTESLVLAVSGGLFGLGVSALVLGALTGLTGSSLPRVDDIGMDWTVFLFAAAVSLGAGVLFGLFPALEVFERNSRALLVGSRSIAGSIGGRPGRANARHILVIGQVALSTVLLVGAGLLVRTLGELAAVDPGFESSGLLTMRVPLPPTRYDTPEKRAAFFNALGTRVEALPGVQAVTIARSLPTTANTFNTNMGVAGEPAPGPGDPGWSVQLQTVRPGYLETLGIPLRRGRALSEADNSPSAAPVALLNETLVRAFWPDWPEGPDPIGRQIGVPVVLRETGPRNLEIVGIVADVHERGVMTDAVPMVYIPEVWYPPQTAYLVLRADPDPRRVIPNIERTIRSVDSEQPITDILMMDAVVGQSLARQRLAGWLLGTFAGMALVLALVGHYGVLAYAVAERAHEIGIRRAVGAQRDDIYNMVLGRGLALAIAGIIPGLLLAFAVTRVLEGLLFETSPTDPATFAIVTILYGGVASAASLIPAVRAARIDPRAILRVG